MILLSRYAATACHTGVARIHLVMRPPPGFIGPVGWLVAMVAALRVGFLIGAHAR